MPTPQSALRPPLEWATLHGSHGAPSWTSSSSGRATESPAVAMSLLACLVMSLTDDPPTAEVILIKEAAYRWQHSYEAPFSTLECAQSWASCMQKHRWLTAQRACTKEGAHHQSLLARGGGAGLHPGARSASLAQSHGVCQTGSANESLLHHTDFSCTVVLTP